MPNNGRATPKRAPAPASPPPQANVPTINVSSDGVIQSLQRQLQEAHTRLAVAEGRIYDLEMQLAVAGTQQREQNSAEAPDQQAVSPQGAGRAQGAPARSARRGGKTG